LAGWGDDDAPQLDASVGVFQAGVDLTNRGCKTLYRPNLEAKENGWRLFDYAASGNCYLAALDKATTFELGERIR
jgi:hypothetical protein